MTAVPLGDPVAVILARLEVKLDQALTEQAKHASTLDRHDKRLEEHGNRLTVLETRSETDGQNTQRMLSARAVLWSAVGALTCVASVILTLVATH